MPHTVWGGKEQGGADREKGKNKHIQAVNGNPWIHWKVQILRKNTIWTQQCGRPPTGDTKGNSLPNHLRPEYSSPKGWGIQ